MAEATERNARKVRQGIVSSIMGNKSIVVTTTERKRHPKYGKMMTSTKKFHVHDEENTAGVGDTVRIMETRPLSATKRWRLVEIIERASKLVEVNPYGDVRPPEFQEVLAYGRSHLSPP